MSEDLHGKQPVDPLIRAALRARQVAPSDRCVEPETLAAWVEGGLDAHRAADVESHLADCARCQSMLAAFEESAEPAVAGPAVVLPFAQPSRLRWIAPVAAGLAAASLVGWMVWPTPAGTPSAPASPSRLADRLTTPAPVPESMSAAAPSPQATPVAPSQELRAPAPAAGQTSAPSRSEAPKLAGGAVTPADPTPPPLPIPTPSPVTPPGAAVATPVVAAPPPPPAATAPPPAATAQPPAKPGSITADAAARADRNVMRVEKQTKFPIEFGPPDPRARLAGAPVGGTAARGGGGGRAGAGAGGVAAKPMMTPEPRPSPNRWRILENGHVERTVDSGRNWTAIELERPVFITAGAAASPTVCWLVGHDGAVFRSIDGATFARVSFPDAIDLTSVTTQDADRATVGTRDGRVFTTTDGGLTWRLF